MAEAKKCDRCGKYYDTNKGKSIRGIYVNSIKIIAGSSLHMSLDLCDDCIDKLYKFLKLENNS